MSGDVINLRQARKARDRKLRDKQAAENRVKFGQSKREREKHEGVADIERRRLDGHRRNDDEEPPAGGSGAS